MKKVYKKPEFEVICQNQANAKFFVASFSTTQGNPVTQYGTDSNTGTDANGTLNNSEGNGFSF